MPLTQKIRERMISIENYAIIAPDATLREAALSLRTSFHELDGGMRTVAGPRTVLVTDENDKLLGILDFMCFLENYFPKIGGLPEKLKVEDIGLRINYFSGLVPLAPVRSPVSAPHRRATVRADAYPAHAEPFSAERLPTVVRRPETNSDNCACQKASDTRFS